MLDHNLFIDLQYQPTHDQWEHGFRVRFYDDLNCVKCTPGSELLYMDRVFHKELAIRANQFHIEWGRLYKERIAAFKQKIARQLAGSPRSYRLADVPNYERSELRQYLKDIAKAIQNDDTEIIIYLLNQVRHSSERLASKIFREVYNGSEIFKCDDCSEYFDTTDTHYAINDTCICSDCCDNAYVWSNCMETYIPYDESCYVYHNATAYNNESFDDRCTWNYGQRNFYEYDGCFISDEDEYNSLYEDEDDEDYEYESDEELSDEAIARNAYCREEDKILPHYHNARKLFVECNDGKYPALGVELEVYAEDRLEQVKALREKFGTEGETFIFERDGSLNRDHGFEIISQPFGRNEWKDKAPELLNLLQEHGTVGFNDPAGSGYGIHVTIHRRHFSPLAEARIAMFFAAMENREFIRALAQRDQIYSHTSGIGMGTVVNLNVRSISSYNTTKYNRFNVNHVGEEHPDFRAHQKKITGRGKYCPVNWKENHAEFRIFQSTTNRSSFIKNLELVWALHAWTKPEAATGNSFAYRDFVRWLAQPAQRYQFPDLLLFISQKTFYGTNYQPITSSWQNLVVKPVSTEAMEPMAA